jgi:putative tryptophan/tyrosine transport system substrate-binding protein
MNRRAFFCGLTLGTLVAPLMVEAQQAGKVYRLGYLSNTSAMENADAGLLSGLKRVLRDLGWSEGGNLIIEARFTEGNSERLAGLVADLISLNVDAIVTTDTPTAMTAKKATTTVPIVMAGSADPVAAGLVASLAKPGGNVTGVTIQTVEIRAKAIQTFLEAVPGISEIGYLVRPDNPGVVQVWREANAMAPQLGVKLRRFDVRQPAELEKAIATMAQKGIGGMVVAGDNRFTAQRGQIAALAARNRLPWLASWPILVEAGALMSYGPDPRQQWQLVARYVDRILKGAKPADLPVEQPTKFELVINAKTAKALGLTIPQSVLVRADHVIE